MRLSDYVKFLESWLEDPRVASYEGESPLDKLGVRMMKRDYENALDNAKTILHLGDDDIYISERDAKMQERMKQTESKEE